MTEPHAPGRVVDIPGKGAGIGIDHVRPCRCRVVLLEIVVLKNDPDLRSGKRGYGRGRRPFPGADHPCRIPDLTVVVVIVIVFVTGDEENEKEKQGDSAMFEICFHDVYFKDFGLID